MDKLGAIGTTLGALALAASILGSQAGSAAAHTSRGEAAPAKYSFQLIASPKDTTFTQLLGINTHDTIAGYFGSGMTVNGTLHPNKGFTFRQPSSFTDENFPNSVQTQVIGIDNAGDTGGFYIDAGGNTHGFLSTGGTYSTVDLPGTTFNQILGLNNRGQAAGFFQDGNGNAHGYVHEPDGSFLVLPIPNSTATGINDSGAVVGFTQPISTTSNGFLWQNGKQSTLDYPGSTFTQPFGENNKGDIVGTYTDSGGVGHGFLYHKGNFSSVDVPASTSTVINGINDAGQFVGFFTDVAGNTVGFVANPSDGDDIALYTSLKGSNEVPGPGSSVGGGTADLLLDPRTHRLCYSIAVGGLAGTPTMAHIHSGAAGTTGAVVVPFTAPTQGYSNGCMTIASDLASSLLQTPGNFYVNVHTTDFPGGAARGQLSNGLTMTTASLLASSVTLTSSLNPAELGTSLTFSGQVTPSQATGQVNVYDNTSSTPKLVGTATISSGGMWSLALPAFTTNSLSQGTHRLSAMYQGDGTYQASTSTTLTQTITAHF